MLKNEKAQDKKFLFKKIYFWIIALLLIIMIVHSGFGNKVSDSNKDESSSKHKISTKAGENNNNKKSKSTQPNQRTSLDNTENK
ncbi:hypothetical protein [Clostridium felsineum]|uniref:hypothetical protein n=1 Tax=Clostridium felsineum TaxID=36839 RepID=UPI00098CCE28|nr:hypothetical protein [Clostridium felsineum]URZ01360.1 hypothetical protein CLAUR_013500 [Clostridium felsineum]